MKKNLFYVLFFILFQQLSLAQGVREVVEKFQKFNSQFPQEKVYVHTDKPKYFTGEDVWFKAYLINAQFIGSDPMSNVLRVELIDPQNRIIDERLLKVVNNGSYGDFKLADSLAAGRYTIRAYTNWMRNFDSDFFYRYDFQVEANQSEESQSSRDGLDLSLKFFPEGGDLIEGIPSIVAFKALDSKGRSVDLSGTIHKRDDQKVAEFSSVKSGIGVLLLTPQSDENLYAKVLWNGVEKRFDLPAVKQEGITMRVTNSFGASNVTVAVSAKNAELQNGFLIGHQAGKIFAMAVNTSDKNSFALSIDRTAFPAGICHLTFFDQTGTPRSERLVFANYPKFIDVAIQPEQLSGKRTFATIDLKLDNDTLGANLSASITPFDEVRYNENSENIRNYLFLGSDLKGFIEEPDFYFTKNKEVFKALDYLMLTHGWRRFKWEEVLNNDKQVDFWVEDGITFSGTIVDFYNREKPRVGKISMSVINQDFMLVEGETNENGRFFMNQADFLEPTDLLFQAKRRKGNKSDKYSSDVFINLDEWSAPKVTGTKTPLIQKDTTRNSFSELSEKIKKINRAYNFDPDAMLLDDIVVMGQRRNTVTETLTSANVLYSEPSNRIMADSIVGVESFGSAFDLIARVPGVRIGGVFPNQSVLIRGATSISSSVEPLYLLNGIPVDGATVSTIPSQDVSFVDVLKGPDAVIYGARASGGVVAIYTKTGEDAPRKVTQGSLNITHPGYSKAREFYTPDYSTPKDEHAKPDIRSTLYWNPNIEVDSTGRAQLEFYTSDQLGDFNIVIQGLSEDGIPIYKKGKIRIDK